MRRCLKSRYLDIATDFLTSSYMLLTAAGVNETVPGRISRTDPAVSSWSSAIPRPVSVYFSFSFRLKLVRLLARFMIFYEYGRCERKRLWLVLKLCPSMEWLSKTQGVFLDIRFPGQHSHMEPMEYGWRAQTIPALETAGFSNTCGTAWCIYLVAQSPWRWRAVGIGVSEELVGTILRWIPSSWATLKMVVARYSETLVLYTNLHGVLSSKICVFKELPSPFERRNPDRKSDVAHSHLCLFNC
jgi:hypothetical protein